MQIRSLVSPLLAALLLLAAGSVSADGGRATPARISLIIDDIGYRLDDDRRALALPGPLSYAILPHTPHGRRMAKLAHTMDKDILVHLPMEALNGNHLLGPGALTRNMDQAEFNHTVHEDIASVPHAIGISNHMGSLLTTSHRAMRWLMQALQSTGLFYMDSLTIANSVAGTNASQFRIPYLQRDVFLDDNPAPAAIRAQFRELIRIAREQGSAIAIGHPHPETIATLADLLPELEKQDVELVSIRQMLQINHPEVLSWQSSSSR